MAQPLRGVTCFVSVGGSAGDASGAVAVRARALGAATTQRLTSSCSHVILGGADAGRAARVLRQLSTLPTGVAVVDARWVEASSREGVRALERLYTVDVGAIAGVGQAQVRHSIKAEETSPP